jgi:hypothetical protein
MFLSGLCIQSFSFFSSEQSNRQLTTIALRVLRVAFKSFDDLLSHSANCIIARYSICVWYVLRGTNDTVMFGYTPQVVKNLLFFNTLDRFS